MTELEIQTKNLRLVLQTREQTLASVEALSPADKAHVSPDWLARVLASTKADPWALSFAVVHRASSSVIGSCGYNGPPDPEGTVEISYGIEPDQRGHGYATEVAEALLIYAFGVSHVQLVRAHTFEKEDASTRVLTKCGFSYVGEVVDPEEGMVWRWEKHKQAGGEPGTVPDTTRN